MILNRTCNERYQEISWPTKAEPDQVLAVLLFGVHPQIFRPGTGKKDDRRGSKDGSRQRYEGYPSGCSGGNLSAEKLYQKVGFQYAGSLNIFYEDTGWADFKLYEYSISDHPDQGAGKGLAGQIE